MVIFVALGAIAWIVFIGFLDSPDVPAWRMRDIYRILALVEFVALVMATWKGMLWHQELVMLLKACR